MRGNTRTHRSQLLAIASATAIIAGASPGLAQTAADAVPAQATSQPLPAAASAPDTNTVPPTDTNVAGTLGDAAGIGEIVVTAQKRAQNLNDVGMSITAVGAAELANRNIVRPEDLVRVVPSLTVTRNYRDTPTYTLRGVGFFEDSLAAAPTVSMYVDQVPLVNPIMARGATLDLERVEVLKGPQGTVFGQNSTGGLINYIAAKPTKELSAGVGASYSRFDLFQADGYISGPIADNVQVRIAGATSQGGAWQRSATRDDKLGKQRFTRGRLTIDAQPTSRLRLSLTASGWIDKGDTQAAQTIDPFPVISGAISPLVDISRNIQAQNPGDQRLADWTPTDRLRRNDWMYQIAGRADYDLTSNITLTSISEYAKFKRDSVVDGDGTPAQNFLQHSIGSIRDISEDLRLAGKSFDNRLNWTIGGNYQNTHVTDINQQTINTDAGEFVIGPFGAFGHDDIRGYSRIRTLAAYASGDFDLTDTLTLSGGVRYTSSKTHYNGCTRDAGDGELANVFGNIQQFALGVPRTTAVGQCVTLRNDPSTPPALLFTTGSLDDDLNQHNVSWRAGVNYKPSGKNGPLLYGNVSRGYKAGSFILTGANLTQQLLPVTQEQLTAYEAGFKAPLFDRKVQINGAAFYYNYKNKQIRARFVNIFGILERLENIPKSRIWGLEGQILVQPAPGLTASLNGTYVNSRIQRQNGSGTFPSQPHDPGSPVPVNGLSFPFTPKLSGTADIQYEFAASDRLNVFLGGAVTYQSRTRSTLTQANPNLPTNITPTSTTAYNDPTFSLPAYATVDLRVGIETADHRWKATVFGQNVLNQFYLTSVTLVQDTIARYTGMPATYGVQVSYKF